MDEFEPIVPNTEYSQQIATLGDKLNLLLLHVKQPNGRRFTYEEIDRRTNINASTISRIRSGEVIEPSFRTMLSFAEVFGVPLTYFSAPMTHQEAEEFVKQPHNVQMLEEITARYYNEETEERNRQLTGIALRASKLDSDGIRALTEMLDYVLSKMGVLKEELEFKGQSKV